MTNSLQGFRHCQMSAYIRTLGLSTLWLHLLSAVTRFCPDVDCYLFLADNLKCLTDFHNQISCIKIFNIRSGDTNAVEYVCHIMQVIKLLRQIHSRLCKEFYICACQLVSLSHWIQLLKSYVRSY